MRSDRRQTIRVLTTTAAVLGLPWTQAAHAAAIWGATEWTQIANWGLLFKQLIEQTTTAAASVAMKITQYKQYLIDLQNIAAMPGQMLEEAIAPYREQLAAFESLKHSLTDLQDSVADTERMYHRHFGSSAKMKMSLKEYLRREVQLAEVRGGAYKRQIEADMRSIEKLKQSADNFRRVAQQTSSITGNIQGLQRIAQTSSSIAAELVEVRALLVSDSVKKDQERQHDAEVQGNKIRSEAATNAELTRQREQFDKPRNWAFPDPWSR